MAKLLSNREMELFNVAINLAVELDSLYVIPPPGMARNRTDNFIAAFKTSSIVRKTVAEKVAAKLSFNIDEDDIEEISQEVGKA